jgi:Ca-activated chloride channel homolog
MPNFNCSFPCGVFSGVHLSSVLGKRVLTHSLVCLMLAFGLSAQAQSSDSQSLDQVHVAPLHDADTVPVNGHPSSRNHLKTMRVETNLVLVPVTVSDSLNRPITSLDKQNFELYEAGELQKIRYFSTEDAPISVGILLDLSSSMTNKIDMARQALDEFFSTSNPEDDYFVLSFADRPELLADATESVGTLQGRLALAKPNGNTALLDAIYLGLTKLRSAKYPRRALFIISDGGDNHSRYGAKEIKRLVQEADVEIYAIGIFDTIFKTYEEWAGQKLLTDITEATGGRTVTVDDIKKLPEAAAAVSRELRNQYVLGYSPVNDFRDDQWHKIKVRLAPPLPTTPLHVYFKKGYLAPGG